MQIGKNIYINIKVNGMDTQDFVEYSDILNFRLVESAGASLPYLYVKFLTRNKDIMNSIQQGNVVDVSIGNTVEDADTFEIIALQPSQSKEDPSGSGWQVELVGFIGPKAYMIDQFNDCYVGNSLMVAKQAIEDYFDKDCVYTDITSVNENQVYWRQNNHTSAYFVADSLLHMDIRPSFPVFAFDRYNNFYIRDIQKLLQGEIRFTFTVNEPTGPNEFQFKNKFQLESYKEEYNLQSGYNKITEYTTEEGLPLSKIDTNQPILASTSVAEEQYVGNRIQPNEIQTSNVHKTYVEAFAHNVNKLMALSSELGAIKLTGPYYKQFKPTQLVKVITNKDGKEDGYYLIDTIVTEAKSGSGGVLTSIYVTRDNKNRVEDNVYPKPKKGIKILDKLRNDITSICQSIKVVYAQAMRFIDGRFLNELLSFGIETKYNMLHSFRVDGYITDFTSGANILNGLVGAGNSLMNKFVYMMLPQDVASLFNNFIIEKPSLKDLLLTYIDEYVDPDVVDVANLIANLVYSGTAGLNDVAKDNGIFITIAGGVGATTIIEEITEGKIMEEQTYQKERQPDVNAIIDDFENNTSGLDIPFPRITLTESEAILPQDKLKDVIADKTINNLSDLGYLNNVDKEKLKDILVGKEAIDFNIINAINKSAGNVFLYRFWGTYNDLLDLTDFNIKKSFKDKYRTIPCTKLISALRNSKIFFACPSTEVNLRFYINSRRIELKNFDLNLGYKDVYGNPIMYTVYYTEQGYNSNSTLFEVRQRSGV